MKLGKCCPLCQGAGHRIFRINDHWIRRCSSCQHRWAEFDPAQDHVLQSFNDSYFKGGCPGYPDYLRYEQPLSEAGRRYGGILGRHLRVGSLLDIGSAAGFILAGIREFGWNCTGVEPNEEMAAYGRNQLGLEIIAAPFEEYTTEKKFDVVTFIQVLQHLIDPIKALDHAGQFTKPGGGWLIETWNVESLSARIFGKHWHAFDPPSVLHWYSPTNVRKLAEERGLQEIAIGRPSKKVIGSHAKSILGHQISGARFKSALRFLPSLLPDDLVLPYPGNDVFWILFQKRH